MPWKEDSKVKQRHRLVIAMLSGKETIKKLCEQAGVSRQTAYKYLARFEQKGRRGLYDHPRANRLEAACGRWKRSVFALRRHYPSWGARKLLYRLRQLHTGKNWPCERTVQKWLHLGGYARRLKRKRAGRGLVPEVLKAVASNALWTVDFKGWFCTKSGAKVQPLTVRDHYSKYLLTVQPVRSLHEKVIRKRFVRLFQEYGLPKAILTDQGMPFCGSGPYGLTRLSLWWHRLGIKVQFVNRKAGITNNAHEQMHQVLQKEVASLPAHSMREQRKALEKWRQIYNTIRPHDAIGLRPPHSKYRPKPKALPQLRAPKYPPGWKTYTVKTQGHIQLKHRVHGIGRAFGGLPIGLEPISATAYRIHFGSLSLGELHPHLEANLRPNC